MLTALTRLTFSISRLVILVSSKALLPIDVTLSGITTFDNEEHPLKAIPAIDSTPASILTEVKVVFALNAPILVVFTALPLTELGMTASKRESLKKMASKYQNVLYPNGNAGAVRVSIRKRLDDGFEKKLKEGMFFY